MTSVTVSFFSRFSENTVEVYKHHDPPNQCASICIENLTIQIRTFEELQKLEDALSEVRSYLSSFMRPPNEVQRELPLVIHVGGDA